MKETSLMLWFWRRIWPDAGDAEILEQLATLRQEYPGVYCRGVRVVRALEHSYKKRGLI